MESRAALDAMVETKIRASAETRTPRSLVTGDRRIPTPVISLGVNCRLLLHLYFSTRKVILVYSALHTHIVTVLRTLLRS
jgi:hypothetical protein